MLTMKTFITIIFFQSLVLAQTDWVRWEAKAVSYEIKSVSEPETTAPAYGITDKMITTARSVYKFMFSDLDGDNCPFYPSCSQFYVDAVKGTDIFKGTLMFIDRFTRDINFFKGWNHYPLHSSGKFFDPAYNYSLNPQKINLQLQSISIN